MLEVIKMQKKIILTKEGLEKLKAELKKLKEETRHEVAIRIKEAKEFGDLSENSEYEAAKNQQAFTEGKIAELEFIIKSAIIKEKNSNTGSVDIGSTVHVEVEGGAERFKIVGAHEADPVNGMISYESPIGKALIGKKTGEEIEVTVPAGVIRYRITNIE